MSKLIIKRRYATTPNKLLKNKSISLKAKGMFGFLQGKPDNWKFSAERITIQNKDGITAVRNALTELEKVGYLKRKPARNKIGKWDGYDYILLEKPSAENPPTGKPSTDKWVTLSKKDNSKKDIVRKKKGSSLSKYTTGHITSSKVTYETIKPTYKTKDKIYKQKGMIYIKKKKTPLQERSLNALLLLNYFKDKATEIGIGNFFQHPSDRKDIENKNGKLRKQAIRFFERCDISIKKAKQVIDWFMETGDWCNYSPETCFSIKTVRDFDTTKFKKVKSRTWEKLE